MAMVPNMPQPNEVSKMETYKVIIEINCVDKPTWIKALVEEGLEYDPASFYSEKGESVISFNVQK
jgi:hypothetical protein